jgi:hypothetical protein
MEGVVREGVGAGGRNDPSLYAHMNNKRKKIIIYQSFTNTNS